MLLNKVNEEGYDKFSTGIAKIDMQQKNEGQINAAYLFRGFLFYQNTLVINFTTLKFVSF